MDMKKKGKYAGSFRLLRLSEEEKQNCKELLIRIVRNAGSITNSGIAETPFFESFYASEEPDANKYWQSGDSGSIAEHRALCNRINRLCKELLQEHKITARKAGNWPNQRVLCWTYKTCAIEGCEELVFWGEYCSACFVKLIVELDTEDA